MKTHNSQIQLWCWFCRVPFATKTSAPSLFPIYPATTLPMAIVLHRSPQSLSNQSHILWLHNSPGPGTLLKYPSFPTFKNHSFQVLYTKFYGRSEGIWSHDLCSHNSCPNKNKWSYKKEDLFHCETIVVGGFVLKEAFHAKNQVKFWIFPDCLTPPILPYFLKNHNCRWFPDLDQDHLNLEWLKK